jgi:hypothetical protein
LFQTLNRNYFPLGLAPTAFLKKVTQAETLDTSSVSGRPIYPGSQANGTGHLLDSHGLLVGLVRHRGVRHRHEVISEW